MTSTARLMCPCISTLLFITGCADPAIQMLDMWAQKFLVLLKRIPIIGYIPVIIQSGADFDLVQQCMELGASGYIRKPYSPKDLLRLIEDTLAQKCNQANGFARELKRDKMLFVAGSMIPARVNGGFML